MSIAEFALERWFAQYEFDVDINLCASCAAETTTSDLLTMSGDKATKQYLNLGLDYIPNPGTDELRKELANLYSNLTMSNIQVTTGASEAIYLLMRVLLKAGDHIVVQKPIYQSLYSIAEALGVHIADWQMLSGDFSWRVEQLEELVSEKTKAIIINSPHSPTGSMLGPKQINQIVSLAEKHNMFIISDEVYRGIIYDTAYNYAPLADLSKLAISIGDMTKPYGLGGLRVGWLASANTELLGQCSSLRDYTTMCCAAPSEFLSVLALQHREVIFKQKQDIAKANLKSLNDFITVHQDKIYLSQPQGGLTVFPQLLMDNIDDTAFCRNFVENYSVLLLPGSTFGYPGYFRMGLGLPEQVFLQGLRKMNQYLKTF